MSEVITRKLQEIEDSLKEVSKLASTEDWRKTLHAFQDLDKRVNDLRSNLVIGVEHQRATSVLTP